MTTINVPKEFIENQEKQKTLNEANLFVDAILNEEIKHKDRIYEKLYRFLSIDLTIFPIITAIFFVYLKNTNDFFMILASFSFIIAVTYKFYIVLKRLGSFHTNIDDFDIIYQKDGFEEFIKHKKKKAKMLQDENNKLIDAVNHSIWFTMSSIVISITVIFQMYIINVFPMINIVIFIIFLILNIYLIFRSISYKKKVFPQKWTILNNIYNKIKNKLMRKKN